MRAYFMILAALAVSVGVLTAVVQESEGAENKLANMINNSNKSLEAREQYRDDYLIDGDNGSVVKVADSGGSDCGVYAAFVAEEVAYGDMENLVHGQTTRDYHYNPSTFHRLTVFGKEILMKNLLEYHRCYSEPNAQTVRLVNVYTGKKMAKYGSHSGLKVY